MISSWALPAPALEALEARLAELKPRLAVESGSGESTLVLARHAEKVVSFEHDHSWEKHVRRRFAEENLPISHVSVIRTRIVSIDTPAGPLPWYNAPSPRGIDFALIDGPPCRIGRGAAGYRIIPNMNPDGEIWVDDYQHMDNHPCRVNRQWVDKWCAEFGWEVAETMTFDMVSLGRGGVPYEDKDRMAVLRKA
jgi:hypothetical protein